MSMPLQLKATTLWAVAPTTAKGIEKYLGSGMVKGVGSGFRILAACTTVTNARQRNAMPADAFLANDSHYNWIKFGDNVENTWAPVRDLSAARHRSSPLLPFGRFEYP